MKPDFIPLRWVHGRGIFPGRALDRAGFKIIASGLCQCLLDEQTGREQAAAERARLEKLFLSLA